MTRETAWAAVEDDYRARPAAAWRSKLGDQLIVQPDGAALTPPAFYILGFNGGETAEDDTGPRGAPTRSARRWFELGARAANAVEVTSWGITERCHWGSPDIPTLIARLGSRGELRRLLRLHADANQAMFAETPALVVWVTGLGYSAETVDDYGLTPMGDPELRTAPLKGVLWREFAGTDGVPYLFTRHPTGARFARGEHEKIFCKLGAAAQQRRADLARCSGGHR